MGQAGAIFVVAGPGTPQLGPVAALVSTAGWARATERVLGRAWIVTPDGVTDPDEALARGSDADLSSDRRRPGASRVPTVVKTAIKDLRSARTARRFCADPVGPWSGEDVRFVFQRHELFQTAGLDLAERLDVPSVLFVPAPVVWEASRWGTRRPGWSRVLERLGERPALSRADVVACGTVEIADQAVRLGAAPGRIVVTPSGVDLDRFAARPGPARARAALGVEPDAFVVGWVGSFRRFHAVDLLVEALADLEGVTLLLVGDGPERASVVALACELGVPTVCTGTVPADRLPGVLGAMDAAAVLARDGGDFHYSPLKVGEYLAAGVPLVAPAAGQLVERLTDGHDALLVPPGDVAALTAALRRLRDDADERAQLADRGRDTARSVWSWDRQVERIAAAVEAAP